MSTVGRVKYYYMNGIMNDGRSVEKVTSNLERIIRGRLRFLPDTVSVTHQHNDSASSERIFMEAALMGGGAMAVTYSLNQERKKQGDAFSKTVGIAGAGAMAGAAIDYAKMQEDKNEIAEILAKRITKFLNKNRHNVANLILHSQGADVGYRALRMLERYRDRIRVVTLGAMTTIPNEMAAQVVNYKFNNDLISHLLALPFEMATQVKDGMAERNVISLARYGGHSAHEYLKERSVQESILKLRG